MSLEETKISASLSRLDNVEKLKGTSNYQSWKQDFESELKLLGVWHYISQDNVRPVAGGSVTAEKVAAWDVAHEKIVTMLKLRCERNPRSLIKSATNAHTAWVALEKYKPRGSGMLNSTFKKLDDVNLAVCDNDPQTYADKFMEALESFDTLSDKLHFDKNWKIYRFHSGLGSLYNSYCEQYNQTHDAFDEAGDAKFTLDYAITRFINTTTNPTSSTTAEAQALAALVNGTFAHTPQSVLALIASGGAAETKIQPGAHAGNSRTFTHTVKYCDHYKKDYHDRAECNQLNPKQNKENNNGGSGRGRGGRGGRGDRGGRGGGKGRGGKDDKDKDKDGKDESKPNETAAAATAAVAHTSHAFSFVACATHTASPEAPKALQTMAQTSAVSTAAALSALWFIDSACTQHMTRDCSVFQTFTPFLTPRMVEGVGGHLLANGAGRMHLECKGSGGVKRTLVIDDVWYVPSSKFNLISQGQLAQQKIALSFVPGGIGIGEHGIVFNLQRNRLYALDTWVTTPVCLAVINGDIPAYNAPPPAVVSALATDVPEPQFPEPQVNEETLRMWHSRHGHLGYQNLKKLAKMSVGMNLTIPPPKDACEPCSIANMKVQPHKHHIAPGRWENDLIHSDLQGPFKTSHDGYQFMITFLDDKTLRSAVYFLPNKDGPTVLAAFKAFLNQVEHGDRKCTRFRSDCGSEYDNYEMYAFRLSKGITWEGIIPGEPQMNGKSERLGQTIQNKASAMLTESGLPQKFWTEFVRAANHLRNRQPVSGRDVTPLEACTGQPPDLSHLRYIGQTGYCQIHRKNIGWTKYKDHAHKGRLLSYEANRFYRMLMPSGKVEVYSNVTWIDNIPPKPSPMVLTPHGAAEVNSNEKTPAYRNKRRNDALDKELAPSTLVPGERASKRRRETSAEPADFAPVPPVQYMTQVRIPVRAQPAPRVSAPQVSAGEPSESPDTLSDDTLTSAPPTPVVKPTTRSMTVRDEPREPPPRRQEILEAHRDLTPDPLALLAKANAPEPYEPKSYKEAMADSYRKMHWELAMQEEVDSLTTNGTWTLVDLPSNAHALGGRWVYKIKRGPQGEVARYKARWVVRGFEQREGIDFNETFASVVKPMSYKAIFALAAALDWELEQMDVKTAFLYGEVDEVIYVTQPTGFEVGDKSKVCKLKKALYGLKQSPRVWYNTLAAFLKELGFEPIAADYSVFTNGSCIISVYVDDILLAGPDKKEIQAIKDKLRQRFEMTDLGPCTYYLGMTVTRDRANRILRLGQAGYVQKFVTEHGMWESKGTPTPMGTEKYQAAEEDFVATEASRTAYQSAVGSLMYAMLGTRPDIAFAVSVVSRYASNPNESHWKAVKRIFRYLRGTVDHQLVFRGDLKPLSGYTDADWAGDQDTRRSTSGYVFDVGSAAISWSSKRQPTVALSTCEAEYIGQTQATKEAVWLRGLLSQLNPSEPATRTVVIYCDNQGAMALAKNPQFHARTKHIDIQHHYVREQVTAGNVALEYIPTDRQVADGLTKALCKDKFERFRDLIGLEAPP